MAEELKDLGAQAPQEGGEQAAQAQAEAEKMIPQSQVNQLIGQKKLEAYQKGKLDALAEIRPPVQPAPEGNAQASSQSAQLSPDAIARMVEDKLAQQNHNAARQQAINGFVQKMQEGPTKYPDFEDKVKNLNLPQLPENFIHLTNSVDNTADVMYDLADNPEKVMQLLTALEKAPHIAMQQLQKLSGSIKANQSAKEQTQDDEPLSHIKPSSTVGMDNGSKTADDWSKVDWLRG